MGRLPRAWMRKPGGVSYVLRLECCLNVVYRGISTVLVHSNHYDVESLDNVLAGHVVQGGICAGRSDDPRLLLLPHGVAGIEIERACPGSHLGENQHPMAKGNDVYLAPSHPEIAFQYPVAVPFQVPNRLFLTQLADPLLHRSRAVS